MKPVAPQSIKGIKLGRVAQFGIVVPDAGKAMKSYSSLYGIGPWYGAPFPESEFIYKGKKIDLDIDVYITFLGSVELELIQVNGGERNIYSDILEKQGGGIHHMGFLVSGYDKKLQRLREAGIEPLQHGRLKSAGGAVTRFAYLDTIDTCGTITELIETKLMGITMNMSPLTLKLGCLTGDCSRVKLD